MAMGTDVLFENHTIKEIQEIEKKLRNDIEKKKEELRQMVGERYRDLMEAADTITEMKDIAAGVTNRVKSIEAGCMQLQQGSLNGGILSKIQDKVAERRRQNSLLYTVAALVKILVDSPEKIWSLIEKNDFVSAVSLFLLARQTHTLLILDPVYQEHKISRKFPIINRQWTSINHLRYVLIQNCELILKMLNADPQNVVGPLCCHCLLLVNSSLEDILLKILDTRKHVIKSIFSPEKSAKDQVCEFVTVIKMTLLIVYALLYCENENIGQDDKTNLLYQTLKKITSKEERGPVTLLDLNSSDAFKFLPDVITDFRPSMNQSIVPCKVELLQSKCLEWLNDVKKSFHSELVNLLSFVNSVKSIALIRQAVIIILSEPNDWDDVSNKLLGESFSIWDFFLKECFFQRIQDVVNEHIRSASTGCQKSIEEILLKIGANQNNNLQFEKDIASYIWFEGSQDTVDNIAWIARHQRNLWNSGELSMKAMGFTPKIQNICQELDTKMKFAVEDVCTFILLEDSDEGWMRSESLRHQHLLLSADAVQTLPFLTQAVTQYVNELSSFIETTLSYLKSEKEDSGNSARIVFLGHLSHAITYLCSHINICLSSDKLVESIESYKGQGTKFSVSHIIKECESWKNMKKRFLDISFLAFQIWSDGHMNQLLTTVDSEMVIGTAEGLLKSLLQWDRIEIQEESEQGNAVKSVLRIPQYVSLPLSKALFTFCCKLNGIGGHVIQGDIRSQISKELLSGLLNVYKKKIDSNVVSEEFNPRLLQVQSLQMLFDVQFLMGLMMHKDRFSDQINQLSQEIINKAVSHIDPFDMDVFSTPLQQNLKKALQKSLSLYGLLASPDQVTYLNSIKAQVINSQMEHNIMLSSVSGSRFPLLPLSSRSNIHTPHEAEYVVPKETEGKPLQSHRSSPNLNAADIPTNHMKSTSFYDRVTAMSSSWFGN